MPTYVLLVDWTEQGVRAVEETVDRLQQGSQLFESLGCKLEHVWWTQGGHDMVTVVDAPDERAMVACTLALGAPGQPPHDDLARLERRRDARDCRPAAELAATVNRGERHSGCPIRRGHPKPDRQSWRGPLCRRALRKRPTLERYSGCALTAGRSVTNDVAPSNRD